MTTPEKKWTDDLHQNVKVTSAQLADRWARMNKVVLAKARAHVDAQVRELYHWRRAELAIADQAPRATLLALAAEIDDEAKKRADDYSADELIHMQAMARALRAAAVRA